MAHTATEELQRSVHMENPRRYKASREGALVSVADQGGGWGENLSGTDILLRDMNA